MVQCCCQYYFTFYFCESLILQIGIFCILQEQIILGIGQPGFSKWEFI